MQEAQGAEMEAKHRTMCCSNSAWSCDPQESYFFATQMFCFPHEDCEGLKYLQRKQKAGSHILAHCAILHFEGGINMKAGPVPEGLTAQQEN